jgi:hypothetical protein
VKARVVLALAAMAALGTGLARAQGGDPNVCDTGGDEPDLILADIWDHERWGASGGLTAFSIGALACNQGTCEVDWTGNPSSQHPVIGQNLFRLENGRLEQIGQAWIKHTFHAASDDYCSSGCIPTEGDTLGVNCSDLYSAVRNGLQGGLGPKAEIDPSTGAHSHPYTGQGTTGDVLYKRLQVADTDLDPDLHPGALWFVEGQLVAQDETTAGHSKDNASYRPAQVVKSGAELDLALIADTVRGAPAIAAWKEYDPGVLLQTVDVPGDGRYLVASRAAPQGGETWRYEYAVQNLDSRRAAASFAVPAPAWVTVSAAGFHDVHYHSGEAISGTDWTTAAGGGAFSWSTTPFASDPNANALRWGTLYNFRFSANRPPTTGAVTIGLFEPGAPASVLAAATIPAPCDDDATCEAGEACACQADCPGQGANQDGDGLGACSDCDDLDSAVWAAPGEVEGLTFTSASTLAWSPPAASGGLDVRYEVLRSGDPSFFAGWGTVCVDDASPSDTTVSDDKLPSFDYGLLAYLVRAVNDCPAGEGTVGTTSAGTARPATDCGR